MDETTFTGFANRAEAGRLLAMRLLRYRGTNDSLVIGLSPGGVITAAAVAEVLQLPFDVLVPAREGPLNVAGRTVIVVDDGLQTESVVPSAIADLRRQNAAHIILAVPVAPVETLERLRESVDEVVYLETSDPFGSVGYWYEDFAESRTVR